MSGSAARDDNEDRTMWIFLNCAMLSIVAHRTEPNSLLVRARERGDIERVFPNVETWEDASADYRYRAVIPRDQVARAIGECAAGIAYPNFKGSVRDDARHDWYMDVWAAGDRHQQAAVRREQSRKKRSPRGERPGASTGDPFAR
jgi:hypothetical protein